MPIFILPPSGLLGAYLLIKLLRAIKSVMFKVKIKLIIKSMTTMVYCRVEVVHTKWLPDTWLCHSCRILVFWRPRYVI